MSSRRDPFEGKTNEECISLVLQGIEKCKEEAKIVHQDFQGDIDVTISKIDNTIATSPHYLALIGSFQKVATEMEEREKSQIELIKAHRDSLVKAKKMAKFHHETNLKISILNRELTRRQMPGRRTAIAPPEYDPTIIQPNLLYSPAVSSADIGKESLSLSSDVEKELLKSYSSEELPNSTDDLREYVVNESSTNFPSQDEEKLSLSAEIRELQSIPLPDEQFSIPAAPPLPKDDVSPRTQEHFNLKPFSVVLEEKIEEIQKTRRSKRTASSRSEGKEPKVRKICSPKSSPIPKLKINVKSLTKVDETKFKPKKMLKTNKKSKDLVPEKSDRSDHSVSESLTELKEEFLRKAKIIPRTYSSDKESGSFGSSNPQQQEGIVNRPVDIEMEINSNVIKNENATVGTGLMETVDIIAKMCKPTNVNVSNDFPNSTKFKVANSTENPPTSVGSSSNIDRKRTLESPYLSQEKSQFRESSKRLHRSTSVGDLNLETKLGDIVFSQLFHRCRNPVPLDVTSLKKGDENLRSILKKCSPSQDDSKSRESSLKHRSSFRECSHKKLSPSHRVETPEDNTRCLPTTQKFDSLIITKKFGSNDELNKTRSVTSVVSKPSTSKHHESQIGSCDKERKLFDGGRIPKKKNIPTPSHSQLPALPPKQPRIPLRSDLGWIIASTPPQKPCYILKDHELQPAEFEKPRNHIFTRLVTSDPDTLVHVTLRKRNGQFEDFIAESTFGWPGVPHLPYEFTRQIIPEVISSGFAFSRGLVREKDRKKPGYKRWERMVFDPFLKYSFCCITILDLEETKVISVEEERFKIPWIRNAHLPVYTHQIAEITLQSDTTNDRADFTFQIHLVDMNKSGHFGMNRIVLGQDFLERYLVSADGSYEKGHLYFENRAKPPRFYKTTSHPKREERYGKP